MFWNEVPRCYSVGEEEETECFDMAVSVFGVV